MKIKDLGEKIWIGMLIKGIVYLSGILLSFVSAKIASDVLPKIYNNLAGLEIYIGLGVFAIVNIILYLLWRIWKVKFDKTTIKINEKSYKYEVIERQVTQKISPDEVIHTAKIKLKSLEDGLRRYEGVFSWTGEEWNMVSLIPNQDLIFVDLDNYFTHYEVRFPTQLKKNEVIEVHLQWNCNNTQHLAKPLLGVKTSVPTQKLSLSVHFDQSLNVKEVVKQHLPTLAAKMPNFSKVESIGTTNKIDWIIDEPDIESYYEIKWKKPL